MGGSNSRELSRPVPMPVDNVQNEDGGFHMLEIHTPSVGLGSFTIIMCVVICVAAFLIYRRYCKKSDAGRGHQNSSAPQNSCSSCASAQPTVPPTYTHPAVSMPMPSPFYPSFALPSSPAFSPPPFPPYFTYPGHVHPSMATSHLLPASTRAVSLPRIETLEDSPRPARRPASRPAPTPRPTAPSSSSAVAGPPRLACDV